MKNTSVRFAVALISGAIAVAALTILIYGTFFQDFLEGSAS